MKMIKLLDILYEMKVNNPLNKVEQIKQAIKAQYPEYINREFDEDDDEDYWVNLRILAANVYGINITVRQAIENDYWQKIPKKVINDLTTAEKELNITWVNNTGEEPYWGDEPYDDEGDYDYEDRLPELKVNNPNINNLYAFLESRIKKFNEQTGIRISKDMMYVNERKKNVLEVNITDDNANFLLVSFDPEKIKDETYNPPPIQVVKIDNIDVFYVKLSI
jgi:hypothetical protein